LNSLYKEVALGTLNVYSFSLKLNWPATVAIGAVSGVFAYVGSKLLSGNWKYSITEHVRKSFGMPYCVEIV
jgi:hypothetical protein